MGDPAKLLERMRNSANCKREELIALYKAFGFEIENRTRHDQAFHPRFPILQTTIPRHTKLALAYYRTAVKLIDRLKVLQREADNAKQQ